MMNSEQKKAADNTSSSYLSLKAELLRKKQDVQRASSSSASSSSILDHLQSTSSSLKMKTKAELDVDVANPSKKKKKNEQAPPPSPPSSSTLSREDEIAFAKSRTILEAKAKLYDQIMSNNEMKLLAEDDGDDENDKSFMVDFERKIYETNETKKQVEYTDSFGRTRLVTPEEYEEMQASERRMPAPRTAPATTEDEIRRVERLHREQMRSKWEADMEALRNKTDVHYEDVLFDEKREHGVGYYKFSTDGQQRAEQMATLNELRDKTKTEQWKFIQEKEKRQSSMAERLNKIRLRKAKEMGIDLSDPLRDEPAPTTVNQKLTMREPEVPESAATTQSSTEQSRVQPEVEQSDDRPTPSNPPEVVHAPQPPIFEQKVPSIPLPQPPVPKSTPKASSLAYPFPVMRTHHQS